MAQILRYLEVIESIIKFIRVKDTSESPKKCRLYRKLLDEYSDCALLRLLHCFLHAAPQAFIHTMVLLKYLWKKQTDLILISKQQKPDDGELGNCK